MRYPPGIYMIKNRGLNSEFEYQLDNQTYELDGDLVILAVAHNNLIASPDGADTFVHQVGTIKDCVSAITGFPGA